MGETIIEGVTNIALNGNGRAVITHADAPPSSRTRPLGPRRVTTVADLRAVLADDVPDVMLAGTFHVSAPVMLARIAERNISTEPGAMIQSNGDDFRILTLADGKGGRLTINGLVIDGGWHLNPGECPTDDAANFSCQISNISECLDAPPDTVGAPEFLQHIQACLFCVIASGLPCHAIFAGRMAAWMC